MKGIKLLSLCAFTLAILLTGVNNHGHSDWSVNTSQDPQFQQLPQEISQPIPAILAIDDQNLIRLRTVIGYLPLAEQTALALAYQKGGDRLFNTNTYFTKISSDNIYKTSYQSFSALLTANSKMFRYGLGCVKKVAIQFGSSEEMNGYSREIAANIATLLNSQMQANNCEARFAATLVSLMIARRRFLLTTIINQTNAATYADPLTMKVITGFKYSSNEVSTVVQAFNAYAFCHHSFRQSIYSRVLEAEQMIGKLDGCSGEKNPNAGMSSKAKNNTVTIIKNNDDVEIGKNLGEGVRIDLKTQNNYLLQGGFGLGNLNLRTSSKTGQSFLMYPSNVQTQITTALNGLKGRTDDFSILTYRLSTMLAYDSSEYRPTASLHNLIMKTYKINVERVKAELAKVERGESCDGDYMFFCADGTCRCSGTIYGTTQTCPINLDFKLGPQSPMSSEADFDSMNLDHDYTFAFSSSFISAFCLNKVRYIYADATSKILGKQVDFIVGAKPNVELGSSVASIIQGCFGVFTNGSKDDKDACRDVLGEKCGIEMDYRCKESGLYDYINQNPISSRILPVECDNALSSYNDSTCFNWIARNFFLGTITIKSTGFLSFNLKIQSSVNKGTLPTLAEPVEYHINDVDPTYIDTDMLTSLAKYYKDIEKEIVVDDAYHHSFPRFSDYLMGVDHEATKHEQSGSYIKTSLLTLMLIFFIGLIF